MLDAVCRALTDHAGLSSAVGVVRRREPLVLDGLGGSFRAAVLASLQVAAGRPLAVVAPQDLDLEALLLDLRAFHRAAGGRGQVIAFPALGVDPYGSISPHPDVVRERIQTLDRCTRGAGAIVLGRVQAWLERLQSSEAFASGTLHLEIGSRIEPEELVERLLGAGYERQRLVESLGELSWRGGIVDVFPPTREHPVRLEFFGDEVESLREFNPRDQRSMRKVDAVELPPASESGARTATLADYLERPLWVELEPETLESEAEEWIEHLDEHYHRALAEGRDAPLPEELHAPLEEAFGRGRRDRVVARELAGLARDDAALAMLSQPAPSFRGRMADLAEEVDRAIAAGERVCFAMSRPGKAERLAEILEEYGVRVALTVPREGDTRAPRTADQTAPGIAEETAPRAADETVPRAPDEAAPSARDETSPPGPDETAPPAGDETAKARRPWATSTEAGIKAVRELEPGVCWVTVADLSAGFRLPEIDLWLSSDHEVFGRSRLRSRPRRFHGDAFKADFRNLEPGDHVVHVEHGIGRFVDVRRLAVDGDEREFMEVAYKGDDRLYLPLDQLHLVQRYRGVEGAKPRLDKLGGASWGKVKSRVKKELRELASELLELYAARKAMRGRAFGEDTPWQREMEDAFEYEETPDQLTAIAEVKADMEVPKPMDRLLCGDVGYGKTEVAMRAAFKAVMDGAQVAVLAPTTVLAHQHWRTFSERMAAFPVRVELLSRFRSAAEQKVVVEGLAEGTVDIVVGTHRLLSKDVRFRDLGLLVIDEEQRFGVSHKEKLKHLKRAVDVLSMTATPIPRTLQMSMIGVRDLSIIESPPKDRFAVATHVATYDPEIIAAALRDELARDGQAFVVHNRVDSIYSIANRLRELVPEARYRVAHGQLPERELESVMLDFVDHDADVLVTTTIIENGLDIPLANTMIINRADRFGLAQLYQLRGRIGRSDRRAAAYLLIPPPDTLSGDARKRLRAIQEFADLGSGFRLAAMDLEIRGAGSLLGERQHGHMAAVGFEMYARLLEETVHELKGEPAPAELRAQLNLGISMQLPVDYIEDPLQRLMIAKRLASARDPQHLEALRDELRDRYGALPRAVEELFSYAELRLAAEAMGVLSVDRIGGRLEVRFGERPAIDLDRLMARVATENAWKVKPPDRLVVPTELLAEAGGSAVRAVRTLFEALQ